MTGVAWWLMWMPLAANLALTVTGPRLARVLPPRVAVRLLPVAMTTVAAGTGFVLASLGFLALAQVPTVAVLGDWSPIRLRAAQPGPVPVEVLAGFAMLVLLGSTVMHAIRACRTLLQADAACRNVESHADLVVVQDDVADAYALPRLAGRGHGRIVVSTGMLRALPADERRVVLAHEAAHLSRRHHVYVQLAELAAAANPLLRWSARGVRLAVEREADELAAGDVGDRHLAARALARAALARAGTSSQSGPAPDVALAAADGFVAHRANALLSPPPRPRRLLAGCLVLLAVVTLVGTAAAAQQTDDDLDSAELPPAASASTSSPLL